VIIQFANKVKKNEKKNSRKQYMKYFKKKKTNPNLSSLISIKII